VISVGNGILRILRSLYHTENTSGGRSKDELICSCWVVLMCGGLLGGKGAPIVQLAEILASIYVVPRNGTAI